MAYTYITTITPQHRAERSKTFHRTSAYGLGVFLLFCTLYLYSTAGLVRHELGELIVDKLNIQILSWMCHCSFLMLLYSLNA